MSRQVSNRPATFCPCRIVLPDAGLLRNEPQSWQLDINRQARIELSRRRFVRVTLLIRGHTGAPHKILSAVMCMAVYP